MRKIRLCEECDYECCLEFPYSLFADEYAVLRGKIEDYPVYSFGNVFFSKPPCPFYNSHAHACTVYEDRPVSCRIFPLRAEKVGDFYVVYFNPLCPQGSQLHLVDYWLMLIPLAKRMDLLRQELSHLSGDVQEKYTSHLKALQISPYSTFEGGYDLMLWIYPEVVFAQLKSIPEAEYRRLHDAREGGKLGDNYFPDQSPEHFMEFYKNYLPPLQKLCPKFTSWVIRNAKTLEALQKSGKLQEIKERFLHMKMAG